MKLNLAKNKKYLLACSYGPDSMCLFHLLKEGGYTFEIAHVNYHLRKESDKEQKALEEICHSLNLSLHILDNKNIFTHNIEEQCRELRYNFFNEIYKQGKFDALLVGHHFNDHYETYLLQKKRKNLVKHYGLSRKSHIKSMVVIRPLLAYTKTDILSYDKEHGVSYALDHTNFENTFERNKIRNANLAIDDNLLFNQYNKLIKEENKALKVLLNDSKKLTMSYDCLLNQDKRLVAYFLYAQCNKVKKGYELSYKQVNEILKLLQSEKPNIQLKLTDNLYFIKEYNVCYFSKGIKEPTYSFKVENPQLLDNQYFYFDGTSDTSNRHISETDYPLTIRTYQKGDQYKIKDYLCSVNRLFIDWKMPIHLRKRWPIIINKDNKIIYIPRYRANFVADSNTNFYVK